MIGGGRYDYCSESENGCLMGNEPMQERLTLDGDHLYADLVFYHVRRKCHVIIDLKTEELTHARRHRKQDFLRIAHTR